MTTLKNFYPEYLVAHYTLVDGTVITIRPARINDTDIIKEFSRNLSNELKHLNYMEIFKELPEHMVQELTQIDYKKSMTLLAIYQQNKKEIVVGMIHYKVDGDGENCEFDMIVTDAWQNKGIGTALTESFIKSAKVNGIKSLRIIILASNVGGMQLAKNWGFKVSDSDEPTVKIVTKNL